jgi:DNA mismatch repair protein MutS
MPIDASHRTQGAQDGGVSVLRRPGAGTRPAAAAPDDCRVDLHLDQVIDAVLVDDDLDDLRAHFHTLLRDADDVAYRHEVFRDLADVDLRGAVAAFARSLGRLRTRGRWTPRSRRPRRSQRLHLDAASLYCEAVRALAGAFARRPPASRALRSIAAHLHRYAASEAFRALDDDARSLTRDLDAVAYALTIFEDRVHVRRTSDRHDYGEDIERTFRRFRRADAPEAVPERIEVTEMSDAEAAVLDLVARQHPSTFAALERFVETHTTFVEPLLERFGHEVRFFLAYLDFAERLAPLGLTFCLPTVSTIDKRVEALGSFDVALAESLREDAGRVVCNDVRLEAGERVLVVTGANQGGKSTFARAFGQLHYLAALGCPVPARSARLPLCDALLTHFERDEDLRALQGRLGEELTRLGDLLERLGPRSVVVMNEAFASTATDDALALGRATLERILGADAVAVVVTFTDELASFDRRVASVVATVDPSDPSRRTFRVERQAADGRAHALAVAHAHGLTYEALRRRLGS